jgi:hypothetical protein
MNRDWLLFAGILSYVWKLVHSLKPSGQISMFAYLTTFMKIALRRLGPEDLPDSQFLLWVTLVVYLLLQVPSGLIVYGATSILLLSIMISLVMLFVSLRILLTVTGYQSRFRQTLMAMLGTNALLTAVSLPVSVWRQATLTAEASAALPSTIIIAILLWSLVVDGHIFARALSKPFGIGMMVSVAYFFLHASVLFEILPLEIVPPR